MKNKAITLDGTNIQLVDNIGELNDGIVMNEVAKPLTRHFCKVVGESKGDILDIGFGLGFSANFFYEMGVKSYTCIEIHDEIYLKALEWSKDKPNVTVIKGDWIDVLPSLGRKFDGIFMDTYGDDLEKYSKFETLAKSIANEGCILSLWEYPSIRKLSNLNFKEIPVHQSNYKLLLRPLHRVCWTYYFAGEFRKKKFYTKKNVIPLQLCNQIIKDNQTGYKLDDRSAIVDGLKHSRKVWIKDLVYSEELFTLINEHLYPHNEKFTSENLSFCKIIKYTEGCLHDRHLETDKYTHLLSDEQYVDSLIVTLNNDFTGGNFLVYDSWIRGDRDTYSNTYTQAGDLIKFSPFQHSKTEIITSGVKYEIFIKVKRKELIHKPKELI